MKIYEMLSYLREETSQKRALSFIKENESCHKTLEYLCNPYIRTGLGKIDLIKRRLGEQKDPDEITSSLVSYFSDCGPGGVRHLKEGFAQVCYERGPTEDERWHWFVTLIATHAHTSFGVGPSTLKKAGIEVPGFGCQLGSNLSDVGTDFLIGKRWRVSEKVDGTRRLFFKTKGTVEAFSRSGKQDNTLSHITDIFREDAFPDNCIYDCELVDGSVLDNWEEGSQSFELRAKSIGKAARKSGDKSSLVAICFDYYDFDSPGMNTLNRTRDLIRFFENINPVGPVRLVKMFGRMDGYDSKKLNGLLTEVLDSGGEGLMLQDLTSPYVFERTTSLLKVKRVEEYKGIIVGRHLGRKGTRLEGLVSALICEFEECTQFVRVGSGLSDLDREIFTKHYDELEGAEVEVEAFSKTTNQQGKISLCFPVFKRCNHRLFKEVE